MLRCPFGVRFFIYLCFLSLRWYGFSIASILFPFPRIIRFYFGVAPLKFIQQELFHAHFWGLWHQCLHQAKNHVFHSLCFQSPILEFNIFRKLIYLASTCLVFFFRAAEVAESGRYRQFCMSGTFAYPNFI